MLFVIDKIRFQKFIAIVRQDRKPSLQGKDSPFLRIQAEKDIVEIASSQAKASLTATVYEPGVLFIRTTLFRRVLQATPTVDQFITFQVDKEALVFADVRMPFENSDMILYTNPAEAPPTYPPPLPKNERIEEKITSPPSLFDERPSVSDIDILDSKLKSLKFRNELMPGSWSAVFDGIHLSVCLHPLQGIAISYYYLTSREACQDTVFIPKHSSTQDIANTLISIHDKLIPK